MRMHAGLLRVSLLSAALLSGCATKGQTGAVVGSIAGAIIGAKVGSKGNRNAGILVGAVVGGATGYAIGRQLDERDKASLNAFVDDAVNRGEANVPQIWTSDHSGKSAEVVASDSVSTRLVTRTVLAETDVHIPVGLPLSEKGARFVTSNVHVRSGPGVEHESKYVLNAGAQVDLVGSAEGGFELIRDKGVVVGYVSSRYLSVEMAKPSVRGAVQTSRMEPVIATYVETEPPARPSIGTRELDLRTSLKCKPVRIRLRSPDGQISEEHTETCMRPDGTWGS